MPIKLGDILGGLVEIEVLEAHQRSKDEKRILIVEGKDTQGNEIDTLGLFGEEAINSALEKGEKKDGKVFIQIPKKSVTYGQKRINWITEPF